MQRSRRLLFVLSPNFLAEKSFSLLECRLGLYLENSLRASIIAVVYRSVSKLACVEVPQLRQATITTVTWRGTRSEPRRSRFWLRLRLALPVRPLALGRRLIDSTSSHSDLAAMALQRAQRIQSQSDRANQGRRNGRTNVSRRDRRTRPRGYVKRGVVKTEEGPQHRRSCSGCAGFMGNVEGAGVELTVETQTQQESCDRTEVRSDPVPETHPSPVPGSTHDAHCSPNPTPIHHLDSDSALTTSQGDKMGKHSQQQSVSGSRTSEEVLPS
ncbi:uncharacterized protein LOC109194615 [Oreochromis niloticus]|uniref:uncharacterized protein LOC109194615 n=1 Tax=Oreochromis niloticus TaxID=8128 RepID=UPI000DF38B71|nr:uncharacterized protein LOC109194615 [Oreochromis niloticus]